MMIKCRIRQWRYFFFDKNGVAALEFAMIAPLLMTMVLGVVELSHFLYTHQKMQNAAFNVANIVGAQNTISEEDLDFYMSIVPKAVAPYQITENDYRLFVYVTQLDFSVGGSPRVWWQYDKGSLSGITRLPSPSFNFRDGDQLITVEIYMSYQSLIQIDYIYEMFGLRDGHIMSDILAVRPRKGRFFFKPEEIE